MKKLIIIFLSIFIAIPNVHAADEDLNNYSCKPNSDGTCPPGCGMNELSICTGCPPGTYSPLNNNSTQCEWDCYKPGNATFTDVLEAYGNTSDYCPWELTCNTGQYWDGQQCSLCGNWIGNGNYSGYFTIKPCTISSRGANMPDSNRYDICDGKVYKLTLKKNRGWVSSDIDLYYKYSTGFAQSENPETWSSELPEVHDSSRRNTLRGYYNNKDCSQGSLVFSSKGDLVENGWSLLGGDKTLYACWDKLTQTINYYYENNISIPGSSHTCTADDDDNFQCIAKAYQPTGNGVIFKNYKCEYTTPNSGNNRTPCGTVNIGGDIPELGNATIYLTIQTDPCPAGYYCEAGTQTSCPGGSTSDSGETTGADNIKKCYMGTGTQFCDSVGCFNLPPETKIYYQGGDEANN